MDDLTHHGALPHRTSNSSLAGSAYATPSSPGVSSNADTSFHSEPDISPASLRAMPASVPITESKAKETISKHLHGREKEWTEIAQRKGRLELLDLPLDVLRCIVKEITHTNDLTALALTHSALHNLAIPHIYSRFDIVWPEATTTAEPRAGVDALTYGLATLVFAKDVFGEAPRQQPPAKTACSSCGHELHPSRPAAEANYSVWQPGQRLRRRGNNYAQFTKKFSLGNGPPEWVSEYLITKEGGKMLGTLVALAVARMHNLEQFVWDMPTGILRDVWQALASLGDERRAKPCRLERVWIRWHNNSLVHGSHPLSTTADAAAAVTAAGQTSMSAQPSYLNRVERPNFSILPPLKSLSVLDIDELAYLDEMSILIERSVERLRELRIGIARHVEAAEWVSPWEGEGIPQTSLAAASTGAPANSQKRFGGVLGAVVGRVFDARAYQMALRAARKKSTKTDPDASQVSSTNDGKAAEPTLGAPSLQRAGTPKSAGARFVEDLPTPDGPSSKATAEPSKLQAYMAGPSASSNLRRLHLETLEMERVPLSITILSGAIDWTKLRDLTIIDCPFHETLWKLLRRKYTPRLPGGAGEKGAAAKKTYSDSPTEYQLRLRKLHTNTVTPTFVLFVRDALPPHTLETLFLQQSAVSPTHVEISSIYTYILKRHCGSLRHLLVDSTMTHAGSVTAGSWRRWLLERKHLSFLTSGRVPRLRELGIAINQLDWHFLLQRLPNIPHVRSLYLHSIASDRPGELGCVSSTGARDLALHILDIVELVPKIELCYLGIAAKCFEIMEGSAAGASADDLEFADAEGRAGGAAAHAAAVAIDSEDDGEGDADGDDGDDDDDAGAAELDGEGEPDDDDDDSDTEDDELDDLGLETCSLEPGQIVSDSEPDEDEAGRAQLRLREILFYDDKVQIFRARHGRL